MGTIVKAASDEDFMINAAARAVCRCVDYINQGWRRRALRRLQARVRLETDTPGYRAPAGAQTGENGYVC